MKNIIVTDKISKSFDDNLVIDNCSIEVKSSSIYGLLGANGAGKTTLFKLLSGLLTPTAGKAEVLGLDVVTSRTEIQGKIGTLIDVPVFYEDLSAADNLSLHLAYMGKTADVGHTLTLLGLDNTGKRPVSKFSMGMRQRLAIARAIVHEPPILLLDEPINGLDPEGIKDMRELFIQLVQDKGMTILISSHILPELEHLVDTIGLMVKGKIVRQSSMDEIHQEHPGNLENYYMDTIGGMK